MNIALDLDGTLITCRAKQLSCLRSVLGRCHHTVDLDALWEDKREGATTLQALQHIGMSQEDASSVSALWTSIVEEPFWLSFDRLFPDARALLCRLLELGTKPTLITARSRPAWVMPQLEALGVAGYLHKVVVVSPQSAADSKAATLIDCHSDIFIGDSESDFQAASRVGVNFTAVSSGQRSRAYLMGRGVAEVYGTLKEALIANKAI